MFYNTNFGMLKLEGLLLKPKFNLLKRKFEFFNTCINHLGQISLIIMILKWHYTNMFEKIDNFFNRST
jgi:hypothetical protein